MWSFEEFRRHSEHKFKKIKTSSDKVTEVLTKTSFVTGVVDPKSGGHLVPTNQMLELFHIALYILI